MNSSPAAPTGTTFRFASSTYVRVLATGRPIGGSGLQAALSRRPELVLVDVGLPDRDGVSVTRELREKGFRSPILMLTARGYELEPSEGQYDFSRIDRMLERAASSEPPRRHSIAVMTAMSCCDSGQLDWNGGVQVPDYVKNNSNGSWVQVDGHSSFFPDWNNEFYLARWEALMAALGQARSTDLEIQALAAKAVFEDLTGRSHARTVRVELGPLDAERQRAFGNAKRDTLPRYCRECPVRFACHGECPKNRFILTPEGERDHEMLD